MIGARGERTAPLWVLWVVRGCRPISSFKLLKRTYWTASCAQERSAVEQYALFVGTVCGGLGWTAWPEQRKRGAGTAKEEGANLHAIRCGGVEPMAACVCCGSL
jgi:hypothetical protein